MKMHNTNVKSHTTEVPFSTTIFEFDRKHLSEQEWIEKIRSGLPCSTIPTLAKKMDVSRKDIAFWLHTTPRTIQRSIEANIPLGLDLSDRVAQLIRVYSRCWDIFQDDKKVSLWLKTPNHALGNVAPVLLLDTIPGMELLIDELGKIEHGVFI